MVSEGRDGRPARPACTTNQRPAGPTIALRCPSGRTGGTPVPTSGNTALRSGFPPETISPPMKSVRIFRWLVGWFALCAAAILRAHDPGISTAQGQVHDGVLELTVGFSP